MFEHGRVLVCASYSQDPLPDPWSWGLHYRYGVCFSRPTLKTVYCMNEAELVDEALKILLEVRSDLSSPETSAQAQGRPDLW